MTTEINPKDSEVFRMPIEEMHTLKDVGLMVMGPTQREGSLKEGDTVFIVSTEKQLKTRVGGIDIRGDSMGLRLPELSEDQVEIGMFVTTAGV